MTPALDADCYKSRLSWHFDDPIEFSFWDYDPASRRILLRERHQRGVNNDLILVDVERVQMHRLGVRADRIEHSFSEGRAMLCLLEQGRPTITIECAFWCVYRNGHWALESSLEDDRFAYGDLITFDQLAGRRRPD